MTIILQLQYGLIRNNQEINQERKQYSKMKIICKRKSKIVISILFSIALLCLGSSQSVSAENTLQIGIDQYEVSEDGKISVYVNQNEGDGFKPSVSESSLMIGKNTLEIENIKSLSQTNEPVTYLCLVDISGSMTETGIGQTQAILKEFVENKSEQDNFCITTMGNDVKSSGFILEEEKLIETIEGIERIGTEDTNLYYSITEALNVLKTYKAVHKKRCLLIFSDGEDDQKKGITQKEAEDAVKDSHIPVFTVVLAGSNLKDAEGSAKILGSFARNSAGGEHYAPLLNDADKYEDICENITVRLQTSLIVSADLKNVKEIGDDTVYIGVELSDGSKKATDGITVPAGNILEAIAAIEEAQGNTEVKVTVINENPEEPEPVEEPSKINKQIVIGILLFIIVLIIAVIILLIRKKSDTEDDFYKDEEFHDDEYNEAAYSVENMGQAAEQAPYGSGTTIASGFSESAGVAAEPKKKANKGKDKIQVTLFQIGPGETESYQLIIKDKAAIGRNKACQLSLGNDTALSGVHCSILYKNGSVFVKDEGSTNGTFVNGVPIVGEYKVEKDDILLIGSSEYRIVWE